MPTLLLTGLPRSGTTLTCALLNACEDTVALAEPIQLERHGDRPRAVSEIEAFIASTRDLALRENRVPTKHLDGAVPDNTVEAQGIGGGLRRIIVSHGDIALNKPLSRDFYLIIKHPAEFTSLADLLRARFPLFAIVRHPLAVMAAWQTVDMPIQRGHMPMAEAFAPALAERLSAIPDRLKRQVAVMDWLLGTYEDFAPDRVLRYEDTIRDPAGNLACLTPFSHVLDRQMQAHDPATRYAGVELGVLARELLAIRGRITRFYPDFEASLEPYLNASG